MTRIKVSAAEGVTTITLARPDKLNALDQQSVDELRAALRDVHGGAVVLVAEGSHFSVGGDLSAIGPLLESREEYAAFLDEWHALIADLETHPAPVVAAVHGDAMAGGLEVLLACDLVVMARSARVSDLHARAGFYPAGGSTLRLPHVVGRRAALWLLWSGEHVDAQRALSLGLVNEVVEDDAVVERATELARRLAGNMPGLNQRIKRVVSRTLADGVAAATRVDREAALDHMTSPEARARVRAFLEPREN